MDFADVQKCLEHIVKRYNMDDDVDNVINDIISKIMNAKFHETSKRGCDKYHILHNGLCKYLNKENLELYEVSVIIDYITNELIRKR